MATAVVLPKQGNSVESCLIMAWKKQVGESVQKGELLVEVETDKAIVQIDSPETGLLLAAFFEVGDDVPVMTNIAVVGEEGDDVEAFRPDVPEKKAPSAQTPPPSSQSAVPQPAPKPQPTATLATDAEVFISPRARLLADQHGVNIHTVTPTGPEGRIIERDIQAMVDATPHLTPAARAKAAQDNVSVPNNGTGIGGRVTTHDLHPTPHISGEAQAETIPLRGVRKTIADNMRSSLQNTAQVTMHADVDARALLDYRKRLKHSDEASGLRKISVNDLLLFAVSRVLLDFPNVNATLVDKTITRYQAVHLGFAVDTPRGLLVPVIHNAHQLSLHALATESSRLVHAVEDGTIAADEMQGGTFTVSNLGALGIQRFTPIINPPQLAILGIGTIELKPIQINDAVEFIPHMGLSLTIDHQIIDGAPGARFLHALSRAIADFEVVLAR